MSDYFATIVKIYQKSLKHIGLFIDDMVAEKEQIPKGTVDEFEAFREKFNFLLKDVNDFGHKINEETGRHDFPEHLEYIKKW